MGTSRFGRMQRATAIIPLALLSAAWTASLAGVGASTAASAEDTPRATLPDGTSVPTEAIEAPASVSLPGAVAPGIAGTSAHNGRPPPPPPGIPPAAPAADQRGETVHNPGDKTCHLP